MSQALRKLTANIKRSNTLVIFINQIRMKIGVMFGCFDYGARVVLADGSTEKIGKIVNQKKPVEVLSMDPITGRIEPRPVIKWFRNGATDEWLYFEAAAGAGSGRRKLTCTANPVSYTHLDVYKRQVIEHPYAIFAAPLTALTLYRWFRRDWRRDLGNFRRRHIALLNEG